MRSNMFTLPIKVKAVTPEFYEGRELPSHSTLGAAAIDMVAAIYSPILVPSYQRHLIPTGLAFEVPPGVAMLLMARSGNAHSFGVDLSNGVGLIDSDYRGEVLVSLRNLTNDGLVVKPGDRICQAMFVPYYNVELVMSDTLSETARGAGGFGHTGT